MFLLIQSSGTPEDIGYQTIRLSRYLEKVAFKICLPKLATVSRLEFLKLPSNLAVFHAIWKAAAGVMKKRCTLTSDLVDNGNKRMHKRSTEMAKTGRPSVEISMV